MNKCIGGEQSQGGRSGEAGRYLGNPALPENKYIQQLQTSLYEMQTLTQKRLTKSQGKQKAFKGSRDGHSAIPTWRQSLVVASCLSLPGKRAMARSLSYVVCCGKQNCQGKHLYINNLKAWLEHFAAELNVLASEPGDFCEGLPQWSAPPGVFMPLLDQRCSRQFLESLQSRCTRF